MTTRPGYVWDATASEWVEIGQAAVVSPFKYQTSQPSSPATGDIWIDSDEDVPSVDSTLYYRWTKTMSGGETSLSGTDNNSLALKYTPGYESVFINGVLQVRGSDYVATTGTTVTGLTALTANDVVMVESIVAYSVGDTYTQTAANSLFGNGLRTAALLLVQDEKASSSTGGTFTSGAWRTRDLNTVKLNNITGASLSSNQVTLPAGTYYLDGFASAYGVSRHVAKIYSITDSSDLIYGSPNYSANSTGSNQSLLSGVFTLTGTKVLELQHRCEVTLSTYGFGVENLFVTNVYSQLKIWKVA